MRLKVLGSSSAGNCYLLENDTECLVIEAGISFKKVKKALDFNISKIVGVIVSHSHLDHAKYVNEYLVAGIPVFRPYIGIDSESYPLTTGLMSFTVKTFECIHDVPCYGFLIHHKEIGRLLFATDTEYIKYRFKGLNHILVECNYSQEIINERYHQNLRDRVMSSHMELETCKDFVRANNNPQLRNVCLLHLSDSNSDERLFKDEMQKIVNCPVYIADKGLEIELGEIPF